MHAIKLVLIPAVTLLFALPSCRGTSEHEPPPAAPRHPSSTSRDATAAELRARRAARAVEHLQALIAVDRKAVELEEQRLAQLRSLFDAGRVPAAHVHEAEQELLRLRERMLHDQQELVKARLATEAADA